MKKTVLITGASKGIGRETALYFAKKGWSVIATMREPEKCDLDKNKDIICKYLDVTNQESIINAIGDSIKKFGKIDVLVNNAGYGLVGIFESITDTQIRKQFDTNVFGLMNVVRAILPHFREKKSGTLINLSSFGGIAGFPLYSLYQASKFAVEGFSESLAYELENINVKVRLIEPGVIKTNFYTSSMDFGSSCSIEEYKYYEKTVKFNHNKHNAAGGNSIDVAKAIYLAAINKSNKLRFPVGNDAKQVISIRKLLPYSMFNKIIKFNMHKKIKGYEFVK